MIFFRNVFYYSKKCPPFSILAHKYIQKKNMTHKTIIALVASIIMAVQGTDAAAQGIKETKGSNGKWEVTATFSKKEWPSWLVNSSYNAEPNIAVNHRGEIFVVLLENLAGVSGNVDGQLFVVSPDG